MSVLATEEAENDRLDFDFHFQPLDEFTEAPHRSSRRSSRREHRPRKEHPYNSFSGDNVLGRRGSAISERTSSHASESYGRKGSHSSEVHGRRSSNASGHDGRRGSVASDGHNRSDRRRTKSTAEERRRGTRRESDIDEGASIRSRRRDDESISSRRSERRRDDRRRRRDRSEERSLRSVRSFDSHRRLRRMPSLRILHGIKVPREAALNREGRIQTLTGAQEVKYKSLWAQALKAWGYPVDIDIQDLHITQCYVPSTSTMSRDNYVLVRSVTRSSERSTKSRFSFRKQKTRESVKSKSSQGGRDSSPAPNSKRMHDLMYGKSKYVPIDEPMEGVVNAYVNIYKMSYQFAPDYISSDDESSDSGFDSDVASVETFKTAQSELSEPVTVPKPRRRSKQKSTSSSSKVKVYKSGDIPKQRLVQHPNINHEFQRFPPITFQRYILKALRGDLIDNFVLRFVRARKWDTDKAIKMLCDSIDWRIEFAPDEILFEGDAKSYLTKTNPGYVKNFIREKSWVGGFDREGNPIFWFQAKKHFGPDATQVENDRYAVTQIEWCRLFLREVSDGVDCLSIVFDLTGFTLRNADYTTIKFLAVAFEAHYPDCLGRLIIYNAPWIFSTVWSIIKHWLDPVVATKVHFVKDYQEFVGHVDPSFIPVEMGGRSNPNLAYPHPQPGDEMPPLTKDKGYREIMLERDFLFMKFITASIKWVEAIDPEQSEMYLQEKIALNIALSNNYIRLDPYIRARGIYDRTGLLQLGN